MARQNPITSTSLYDTDQVSLLVKNAVAEYDGIGAVDCITNPGKLKHELLQHKAANPNEKTTVIPLFYHGTNPNDVGHFVAAVRDVEVDAHGNEQEVIHIQDSNGNIRNVPPGIEDALQKAYPGAQIKQWDLRQQNLNGECGPIAVQNLRDMAKFKHDNPGQPLDDSALSIQAPRTQTEIESQRTNDNDELGKLYRQEQAKSQEAQKAKTKSTFDMLMDYTFGKGGLLDFRRTSLFTFLGGDILLDSMENAEKKAKAAKANAKLAKKFGSEAGKDEAQVTEQTAEKEEKQTEQEHSPSNTSKRFDLDTLTSLPSDPGFAAHHQKQQRTASLAETVSKGNLPSLSVSEATLTDLGSNSGDKSQSFADQVKSKQEQSRNNGMIAPSA